MDSTRPLRIAITGVECSGKTTLAHALGSYFGAPVVREVGRDYFMEKLNRGDATVFAGDLIKVLNAQAAREDEVAQEARDLMIMDTDVMTIAIWHARYIGSRPEVDEFAERRRRSGRGADLYILCAPDFPFVPDEIRTGDPLRASMHPVFHNRLVEEGVPFIEVRGPVSERLRECVEPIEELLARRQPSSA